jgi:leucyl aminopeptidase
MQDIIHYFMGIQYNQTRRSELDLKKGDCVICFAFQKEDNTMDIQDSCILSNNVKERINSSIEILTEKEILTLIFPGTDYSIIIANLGLKKAYDSGIFRKVYSKALIEAKGIMTETVYVSPPVHPQIERVQFEIVYTSEITFYNYDEMMKIKSTNHIKIIYIVTDKGNVEEMTEARKVAEATNFVRDLSNKPPNIGIPALFETKAKEIKNIKLTALNRSQIKEIGMGGLESVSRGSAVDPKLLVIEYSNSSDQPILLVGKGITFDSGGISIKPWQDMDEMKFDKSGAATVLGIIKLVSDLNIKTNIVAITPLTENMPGGGAYKPGDIIKHYNGVTSEVISTDAEGRLVLADALSYGIEKFRPKLAIDFATLTGASIVALGTFKAGLFSNDNKLIQKIMEASEKSWEDLWNLPLGEEYRKQIKSKVADIMNAGGRWGGASTAAAFLSYFVGSTPWIHIDFPGVAYIKEANEDRKYLPIGSTGFGVRLIYEFLKLVG